MDWLFSHSEDPDIDDPFEAPKGNVLASDPAAASTSDAADDNVSTEVAPAQAQSLKCDECGKQLRSDLDVQAHAARTGHTSFSESTEEVKPLTAEEKERQMALVQEKIKKKRVEREEKEKAEAKEKERLRRTQGKDISAAKFELEQKEMRQLAEQKRREKAEERAAKQRALDNIRHDKEARTAARAAAKGEQVSPPAAAPAPEVATAPIVHKEYTECRLQIRLPTGQPVTQTFKANESLAAVKLFISLDQPQLSDGFTFMTTFPRKVYSDEDMDMPLYSLAVAAIESIQCE